MPRPRRGPSYGEQHGLDVATNWPRKRPALAWRMGGRSSRHWPLGSGAESWDERVNELVTAMRIMRKDDSSGSLKSIVVWARWPVAMAMVARMLAAERGARTAHQATCVGRSDARGEPGGLSPAGVGLQPSSGCTPADRRGVHALGQDQDFPERADRHRCIPRSPANPRADSPAASHRRFLGSVGRASGSRPARRGAGWHCVVCCVPASHRVSRVAACFHFDGGRCRRYWRHETGGLRRAGMAVPASGRDGDARRFVIPHLDLGWAAMCGRDPGST